MATIVPRGRGDLSRLADGLLEGVLAKGMSCELVEQTERTGGGARFAFLVFEKFFFRASNRLSLSALLIEQGGLIDATLVGAGGGQGPLLRFDWGSEENFAGVGAEVLEGLGFTRV